MIRIEPRNIYSSKDGEIVGEWLTSSENEVPNLVQKILKKPQPVRYSEVPTGITPESELWQIILKVGRHKPKLFGLILGTQTAIFDLITWKIPVNVAVGEIMDVNNNYSVRPEIVITLWEKN